jgi:hypothetical protein
MRKSIARITVAAALATTVLGATAGSAFAQNSSAVVSLGKLGRVELTASPATPR